MPESCFTCFQQLCLKRVPENNNQMTRLSKTKRQPACNHCSLLGPAQCTTVRNPGQSRMENVSNSFHVCSLRWCWTWSFTNCTVCFCQPNTQPMILNSNQLKKHPKWLRATNSWNTTNKGSFPVWHTCPSAARVPTAGFRTESAMAQHKTRTAYLPEHALSSKRTNACTMLYAPFLARIPLVKRKRATWQKLLAKRTRYRHFRYCLLDHKVSATQCSAELTGANRARRLRFLRPTLGQEAW